MNEKRVREGRAGICMPDDNFKVKINFLNV